MTADSSDQLVRARILLGAIRARWTSAVILYAVAVLAIAAAAIGPMFLQSARTSVLSSSLAGAPPGEANLSVISDGGSARMEQLSSAAIAAQRLSRGLLAHPLFTVDVGSRFVSDTNQEFAADVLARSEICAHLQFIKGSCPGRKNQVAISSRSAGTAGVALGSRLRLFQPSSSFTTYVTVVAVYVQPASVDDGYWQDNNYFAYGTGSSGIVALDPLVASSSTALGMSAGATPQLVADFSWRAAAPLVGAPALESIVTAIKSLLFTRYGLVASTGLGSVIGAVHHEDDLMSAVVLAIALQLVLVALLILYTLGRSTSMARREEAEFARRHGFPRSALISLALGEPATLIVAALPIGLLLAWGTLEVLTQTLFVSGTPVSVNGVAISAAVGASLGGIAAMASASYELWQRPRFSNPRRARLVAVTVDAFALALALAGLLALATKGSLDGAHADPLASFAPGLLALGAGVIGLRVAALVIRVVIARSSESTRVASFLALRQIGRRPSMLRQLLPLTAATAVVLFSVGSFFLASSNRSLVANFDVGASRVVDVAVPPGLDLEAAVRRADPSRHEAMAAASHVSSSGEVLAVDSTRLAAVASWPATLSAVPLAVLARELAPTVPAGVSFSGTALRLTLEVKTGTPPLELDVNVFDQTYDDSEALESMPIRDGVHSYDFSLTGACPGTCRLLNLSPSWVDPDETDAHSVQIVLRGIAVRSSGSWRNVTFGANRDGTWDAQPTSIRVEPDIAGSAIGFEIPGNMLASDGLLLSPVDLPTAIPAIVTNGAEAFNPPSPPGGQISVEGLDGGQLSAQPVAVVPTLPLIGNGGALIDLGLAQRAVSSSEIDTTFQVWLAPTASAGILGHLRSDGITIGSITLASTRLGVLDHSGIALAYAFGLIVSPLAALLAIGTVAFGIAADGRARRREIASLEVAGVAVGVVRRSLLFENLIVLAVALFVGAGIGFGADSLALSSLPEFASGTGGLPISAAVPIVPFFCALGGLGFLLLVAADTTTRSVIHRNGSSRLGKGTV